MIEQPDPYRWVESKILPGHYFLWHTALAEFIVERDPDDWRLCTDEELIRTSPANNARVN